MGNASTSRSRAWPHPSTTVALLAGALIGGWSGAYMRSSGMFYADLFVGAVLIVTITTSLAGAVVATRIGRGTLALALKAFAIMAAVSAVVLFAVSSPYRGENPGVTFFGRATMRTTELAPFEWPMGSRCLIRDGETSVFSAEVNLRYATSQTIGASMHFIPSGSWPRPGISIGLLTSPESPAFYAADFGSGADIVLDSTDGLRGHVRFSMDRVPDQFRSPRPDEPDHLTGTLEWDCTVAPSP